ncbi:MAG: putative mariner transposase [Streblomastix strix]|uniref:Putative mariner transposase n=1 Tax=Streblomastix strix TaxID=222440 RepID=A0A5J4VTD0_9EUKA|nr:MAG: putative mariner transposase [Streblomastix strix]
MPRIYVSLGKLDFIRFRAVALDHFIRGENHVETYVDMISIYGSLCPELDTIRRWRKAYEDEQDLVRYVIPSGRLRIHGLGNELTKLISLDRNISLRRLADTLGHDKQIIKRIIREETDFKRVHLRWVPRKLTTLQRIARVEGARSMLPIIQLARTQRFRFLLTGDESYIFYVNDFDSTWIRDGEKVPQRARRIITDPKILLTVFWTGEMILFKHWTFSGKTMTSTRFTDEVLKPMVKIAKIQITKEKGKLLLHMDNATSHTAKYTKNYIAKSSLTQIRHPAYSPDLAPSDYYLFGVLKKNLKGNHAKSPEQLQQLVENALNSLRPSDLKRALDGWEQRLKTVIRSRGAYI